jgi:pimeloyl-ACP methyl ester carboxylesterase
VAHLIRVHLRDHLEDQVARLTVPVLVLRARHDRLSTDAWAQQLAGLTDAAECVTVPGAHAFVWVYPDAWSAPLRQLVARAP